MTAKEKAISLFNKFNDLYIEVNLNLAKKHWAKQSALIAVDEVIEQLEQYGYYKSLMTYWDAVKQEIQNL